MTPASQQLLALARQLAAWYMALPTAQASMVTGSVADGLSDGFSDVDMAVYYQELPSEEHLAAIRQRASGLGERKWLIGSRESSTLIEAFAVAGVECQVIHATPQAVEAQIDGVLLQHEVGTPTHKAMAGLLKGLPLYGQPLLQSWKNRIARFPEQLADKTILHHLQFFPFWGYAQPLLNRDAALFFQQSLLEGVQNLLGVLAGLNKVYYSTFQFKRTQKFVQSLHLAPVQLYERLEGLWGAPLEVAGPALQNLWNETLGLVQQHRPHLDIAGARRRVGWQAQRWDSQTLRGVLEGWHVG